MSRKTESIHSVVVATSKIGGARKKIGRAHV